MANNRREQWEQSFRKRWSGDTGDPEVIRQSLEECLEELDSLQEKFDTLRVETAGIKDSVLDMKDSYPDMVDEFMSFAVSMSRSLSEEQIRAIEEEWKDEGYLDR